MEPQRHITTIQAAAILISSTIGVGVLPLPLIASRAADTGAPLITLLAILLTAFGLWFLTKLGMRFPNESIVQYSEALIGKWLAWLMSILIIIFFAALASLAAREFGEVVITSVLKKTPLEVTVIVMLLLAALSSRQDMTTYTYINQFYLPLIVFPAVLIVALSLQNASIIYLQPVWSNEPAGMFHGVLVISALLQVSFVITMVIPHMNKPQNAMKSCFSGLAVVGILYLAIVTAAIGVFGPEETKKLLWPTLELAKTTSLPGNILERLDAAFLALWVTAVFTTLFSSYYFTIHSLSKLLRLKDHKMLSMFILPFLFAAAMTPQNVLHMYFIIALVGRIGLSLTIGYPIVLYMIAVIRNKRGDTDEARHKDRMA